MNSLQLPAFASGGAIGETGPQLAVTPPARIYSASQPGSVRSDGGNSASVVAELRALGARLDAIEANTRAGALNGGKLVKTIDRITDGGNAMLTKAVA